MMTSGAPAPTARATHDVSVLPTPDATRPSVLERQSEEQYTVLAGDSLNAIGERYGVTGAEIAAANRIATMLSRARSFQPFAKARSPGR